MLTLHVRICHSELFCHFICFCPFHGYLLYCAKACFCTSGFFKFKQRRLGSL